MERRDCPAGQEDGMEKRKRPAEDLDSLGVGIIYSTSHDDVSRMMGDLQCPRNESCARSFPQSSDLGIHALIYAPGAEWAIGYD